MHSDTKKTNLKKEKDYNSSLCTKNDSFGEFFGET